MPLPTFGWPGGYRGNLSGINDSGDIVGSYLAGGSGGLQGFVSAGGKNTTIDFPGATQTEGYGINDSGDIVGYYQDKTGNHGFLRDVGGKFTTIDFPGGGDTRLYGINDFGTIVGNGFLRDVRGNFITNLPCGPNRINNIGQILGSYGDPGRGYYICVGTPSGIISVPTNPSGPASGITGTSYSYSTGGAISSLGNPVEYQFDWKGDGSDLSPWGSATQSKAWTTAGTYTVRARACDTVNTTAVSDWSSGLSVSIRAETVSTPAIPSGPSSGVIIASYTYTTGGSTSSFGNPVEYQFDWSGYGDDLSNWGSETQSKVWTRAGVYNVRARARSVPNVSVMSGWSNPLTVSISVPRISVTPTTYDFRNVKVRRSKVATFRVTNNGTINLLMSASITGTDGSMFTITGGGSVKTIKPGKAMTFRVTFKPTSTGPKASTLEITSNDPITPTVDITLSGTGQ